MRKHRVWMGLLPLGFLLASCGVGESPEPAAVEEGEVEDTSAELSQYAESYVTLRRDLRRCVAPLCGGYWALDVNRSWATEKYVSALDFGPSGLSADWAAKALAAGDGELVVKGKLGKAEPRYKTRQLLVSQAYRGMPGVKAEPGATYYFTEPRNPPIVCITAPCSNLLATKLNRWARAAAFDGYDVSLAAKPFVDPSWLMDRAANQHAVVAGRFVDGQQFPGGKAQVLKTSQLFVKLPDVAGPCPLAAWRCPSGQVPVSERQPNRCVVQTGCAKPGPCLAVAPPVCEAEYTLESWRVAPNACPAFACDPTFVVQ